MGLVGAGMKGAAGVRTKDSFCFQTRKKMGLASGSLNTLNVLDRDESRGGRPRSSPEWYYFVTFLLKLFFTRRSASVFGEQGA